MLSINFELANAALFSAVQSGNVLLATFIGGAGHFVGPILGAVLVTYLQNMLSDVTEVWQLYFGLMFIATVMYAPGGLAGLIMMHGPIWRAGALLGLLPAYALMLVPIAADRGAAAILIDRDDDASGRQGGGRHDHEDLAASVFDAKSWLPWVLAMAAAGGRRLRWRASPGTALPRLGPRPGGGAREGARRYERDSCTQQRPPSRNARQRLEIARRCARASARPRSSAAST